MLENLKTNTTAERREATGTKAGNRIRPFVGGQVLVAIAFVCSDTKVGETVNEQEGILCLDGRFLPYTRLFGNRTIDDSERRYSPFDSEVWGNLPAAMRTALNGSNLGTSGAQLAQMWANLGISSWNTDWGTPVPVKVTLQTARTGGSSGLSRWYWFENASAVTLPTGDGLSEADAKKVFLTRFSAEFNNAELLWQGISADATALALWRKVLALPLQ